MAAESRSAVTDAAALLTWSTWVPLEGCWRGTTIPALPGLYRIRRAGRDDLDYIGQTGSGSMHLRQRLGMLKGIYAAEMPYRDPHTAAPALWALRHATTCAFEGSVCPVEGTTPWRKGLEALAIALHRQEHGRSPTVEFGRGPAGYRLSSHNRANLVVAGLRFRGGPSLDPETSQAAGVPPAGSLNGDPEGSGWGGHAWSPWVEPKASQTLSPGTSGLYRIRGKPGCGLLYVGQGALRARLRRHVAKVRDQDDPQGGIFAAAPALACSWVIGDWLPHQRLELENDLIAAHILTTGGVPAAQFLG